MDKEKVVGLFKSLQESLKQIIIGKSDQIEKTLICLLADGHLLLEDLPGVGKTTLASSLAQAIGGSFSRIQFTADLLPSDIIGTRIYRRQTEEFEFVKGPIFANVILADELNRAPPKTQSALLQAMNEYSVSVDKQHFDLNLPFMVIATQNPRGFHGTYPLPESQRDRFLMRISMGYPDSASEIAILKKNFGEIGKIDVPALLSLQEILNCQKQVREIQTPDHVLAYITRLTAAVRGHAEIDLPVSPRGSIGLMRTAQAAAFIRGQDFITIDLVKDLLPVVWCHRIGLKGTAGFSAEGVSPEWLKHEILQKVEID